MKTNLSLMLFLLPFSIQAADLKQSVSGLTELLENPKVSTEDCVDRLPAGAMKSPKIKKGEVKISYSCADFKAPAAATKDNQLEAETIKFYIGPALGEEISVRSRVNKSDKTKHDVTVKYRPANQTTAMSFDETQYKKFKDADDKKLIDLKCEADVSYGLEPAGLKTVNSCSVTTSTEELTKDHLDFVKMVSGKDVKPKLAAYVAVTVESLSWKQPHESFPKPISFEKWVLRDGTCILEASAKFEALVETPEGVKTASVEAMKSLKLAVEGAFKDKKPVPSSEQGNKTNKVIQSVRSR